MDEDKKRWCFEMVEEVFSFISSELELNVLLCCNYDFHLK